MIRDRLIGKGIGDNKQFRWRSHEVSRLEGLSDAVFGFAITLMGRRRRKLEQQFDAKLGASAAPINQR